MTGAAAPAVARISMPLPLTLQEYDRSGVDFSTWHWLDQIQSSATYSAATKGAAYALATWFRGGDRICWPSLPLIWRRMGNDSGRSERVTGYLTPLVSDGLLEREPREWTPANGRKGFTYVYAMTLPHLVARGVRILDQETLYRVFTPQKCGTNY